MKDKFQNKRAQGSIHFHFEAHNQKSKSGGLQIQKNITPCGGPCHESVLRHERVNISDIKE